MTKLHRVLAAVDFSEPARAAFDHALALSRLHDAELTIVHAVPTDRPLKWHARERIALIGALLLAAEAAGVRFKVSVQHGDPSGVILLHASSRQADLIVLGSSKRSGLDRFRFGSVAETVAREATQPVLVMPAPPAVDPNIVDTIAEMQHRTQRERRACSIAHSVVRPNRLSSQRHVTHGGVMSARNGERARFHRNRKRRVVQRMRLRALLLVLKEQKAVTAAGPAAPVRRSRGGPALAGD